MNNLVILYNPYYNQEVIEDHIRILNQNTNRTDAKVVFGKDLLSAMQYKAETMSLKMPYPPFNK